MRVIRLLYLVLFLIPVTTVVGVVNVRLYYTEYNPQQSDVVPQLAFIKEALQQGAGEEMQQFFPEGYFFTYALYGLTWVNVGLKDATLAEQAITESQWAMERLESPQGRGVFSAELTPPYGVFYVGWSNWLRGGILKLQAQDQRDPAEVERYTSELSALAAAFDQSETPFLAAYPSQAWPVDSTVAVAALHLHDTIFPPQFEGTIQHWIERAKAKFDPATGLLPHQVNYRTGDLIQGTRGSSQSVIQRFLPEIDPVWARKTYPIFREKFAATVLGIPGIREYPVGNDGMGDVDSGPLFAGMSLSSSVVTVGAAKLAGDGELANAMLNVGEALGMPIEIGGSKRYALGVLPTGDAFLAWAKKLDALDIQPCSDDFCSGGYDLVATADTCGERDRGGWFMVAVPETKGQLAISRWLLALDEKIDVSAMSSLAATPIRVFMAAVAAALTLAAWQRFKILQL